MNSIEWLQSWYKAQCNGDWEHQYGVEIVTIDNPGWRLKIDLTGTPLDGVSMPEVRSSEINHAGLEGNQEWLHCKVEGNRFVGAGGPTSLLQVCEVFKSWFESRTAGA